MHETQTGQPPAAAQAGITEWHRIVAESDWESLPDLLAETVVFRNPATIDSQHGKDALVASLRVVFSVLQDYEFLRHFGSATGYVLEFSARVGNERLVGVDLIEFDDDGKITDFMVMMRPASTVMAVA